MSGFTPLDTTKPVTNEDLAEAYNRIHNCVHDGFAAVNVRVDGMSSTLTGLLAGLGLRQQVQTAVDSGSPEKVKPRLAGMSRATAMLALIGAAVSAAGAYKYLFPAIEAGLKALHMALMGA